jgi:hypothetical protein
VNGTPALIIRSSSGTPAVVITVEVAAGRVRTIHAIANPDKLHRL